MNLTPALGDLDRLSSPELRSHLELVLQRREVLLVEKRALEVRRRAVLAAEDLERLLAISRERVELRFRQQHEFLILEQRVHRIVGLLEARGASVPFRRHLMRLEWRA